MKLVTRKLASKSGKGAKTGSFLVMNEKEWRAIGKKAGFIKTQAKTKFQRSYERFVEDMQPISTAVKETLSKAQPDGKSAIDDPYFLELAKQYTGTDYKGQLIPADTVKSIAHDIMEGLKEKHKLIPAKVQDVSTRMEEGDTSIDTGELALTDQLGKKIVPEEGDVATEPEQVQEISSERSQDTAEELSSGAVHPLDLFDEALIIDPNSGDATVENSTILDLLKTITGVDYSNRPLSPEAQQALRSQVAEYYRPKVSDDEPAEEDVTEPEETIGDTPVGEYGPGAEDPLPAAPPVLPENLPIV